MNMEDVYRGKIVELIEKIKNPEILASIYSFAMGILSIKKQGAD